eukprot:403334852
MAANISESIIQPQDLQISHPQIFDTSKQVFPYIYAVLAFEILVYLFEQYLNWRQYKKYCEKEMPKEITTIVTIEQFEKSQAHNKDKMEFELLKNYLEQFESTLWQLFRMPVWLWGYSVQLCELVGLNPDDDSQRTLAYMGFIFVIELFKNFPWTMYSIFVIQERHGFNKQTIGQIISYNSQIFRIFIKDIVKSTLLQILIGGPVIYFLLKIIEWGGENFYLYVFSFLVVFQLIMMHIFPNYIQPLFNKFTELPEGELRQKIEALASRLNFPLKKLYVVDESTRSAHSNAYFYGFGSDKRIVIYDTLLKQCNDEEIVAILGHELGHWSMNHNLKNMIIGFTQLFAMFYLFSLVINYEDLYISFGFDRKSTFIGLSIFLKIYQPVQFVIQYLMMSYIRKLEFQADEFSMNLGYKDQLGSSLIKIHVENATNMNPDFYYANYHYNHPILIERLRFLKYEKPVGQVIPDNINEKIKDDQNIVQDKKND